LSSKSSAPSPSAFKSHLSNPISNDEFAKKFADTKAALSSTAVKKNDSVHHQGEGGVAISSSQEVTDVQYRRFSAFIEEKCGIVLGSGKQYLVNSRLSALLPKFHISNIDELINFAMEEKPNNKIQEAVVDAMTTNETLWFRDTYPYTALEEFILPELAKKGKYPVRIWSAACSSGQEPYSIGIVVQEQMAKMLHVDPKQTQIIGTDLSPEMLATCKLGQYDVHALSRGLSPERKSRFFKPTRNPNLMQIDPKVKSMVEFRPMNLLGSYALMGRFDVIFCRNVLIYFSNDVKAEILRKLTMCLNPRGYLILGSTETLVGVADKYEMIRHSPGILYRLKATKFAFD
jgi:chemotaxis methyl-accepting protein methylase